MSRGLRGSWESLYLLRPLDANGRSDGGLFYRSRHLLATWMGQKGHFSRWDLLILMLLLLLLLLLLLG